MVISHNKGYQHHFESIFFGRAERSSGGRFDLWQRGTNVLLDRDVPILGIGLENFREVDGRDKQLHNDFLAFVVERGFLGALGLVLLGMKAVIRALNMLFVYHKYPERVQLNVIVFLIALVATLVESLTHQIFHDRQLWLVLAVQEAMYFKLIVPDTLLRSNILSSLQKTKLNPEYSSSRLGAGHTHG